MNIQDFLGYLLTLEDTKIIAYIGNSVIKIFCNHPKLTHSLTHAPPTMAVFQIRVPTSGFEMFAYDAFAWKALTPSSWLLLLHMSGLRFSVIDEKRLSRLSTMHALSSMLLSFISLYFFITICSYFCIY